MGFFRTDGKGWTCAGSRDGDRVNARCRTGRVSGWQGSVFVRYEKYEGEIFTDYYFGEANTANKSGNQHNNAINENLNWGGISGLLQFDLYLASGLGTRQNKILKETRCDVLVD